MYGSSIGVFCPHALQENPPSQDLNSVYGSSPDTYTAGNVIELFVENDERCGGGGKNMEALLKLVPFVLI